MGNISNILKGLRIENVPDDVLTTHLIKYLSQYEIVRGLSEVNKYYSRLIRHRYKVAIEVYPFEPLGVSAWTIENVKYCFSTWSLIGMSYQTFMEGLVRNNEGWIRYPDLKNGLSLIVVPPFQDGNLPKQFLTLPLKSLDMSWINIENSSFMADILSITTLESLALPYHGLSDVESFPQNLKSLSFRNQFSKVQVKGLPESLESLQICGYRLPSRLPRELLRFDVSYIHDLEFFPSQFPSSLEVLIIASMRSLRGLQSLSNLNSLRSIELKYCPKLSRISELPRFLRRLKIESCEEINFIEFPPHLEELAIVKCDKFKIQAPALPRTLRKLRLDSDNNENEFKDLKLTMHLNELHLERIRDLNVLPDLSQQCLQVLILKSCQEFKTLHMLPGSLRRLELCELPRLESLQSLPKDLIFLSLSHCENLRIIDQIPSKLISLEIGHMTSLQFNNLSLPDTLTKLKVWSTPFFHLNHLPPRLEQAHFDNLPEIEVLPPFPATLKMLKLLNMECLRSLPQLPDGLEILSLTWCKLVELFPPLPRSLKVLEFLHCSQIQFVGLDESESQERIGIRGKLPDSLRKLSLTGCRGLEKIGELPENLKTLSIARISGENLLLMPLPKGLVKIII